jgi:hypothetical protein
VRSSAPAVGCVLCGCAALGGLVLALRRRVRRAPSGR